MTDKLKKLTGELLKLTAQSKLVVAIGLLDRGQPEHAEMVIDAALAQIRGDRLFGSEAYARLTLDLLAKVAAARDHTSPIQEDRWQTRTNRRTKRRHSSDASSHTFESNDGGDAVEKTTTTSQGDGDQGNAEPAKTEDETEGAPV